MLRQKSTENDRESTKRVRRLVSDCACSHDAYNDDDANANRHAFN